MSELQPAIYNTPVFEALAAVVKERFDLFPRDLIGLYDITSVDPQFLPFLGQMFHADTYTMILGEAYERKSIIDAPFFNRLRGTQAVIDRFSDNVGVPIMLQLIRGPGFESDVSFVTSGTSIGVNLAGSPPFGGITTLLRQVPLRLVTQSSNVSRRFAGLTMQTTGNTLKLHGEDIPGGGVFEWKGQAASYAGHELTVGNAIENLDLEAAFSAVTNSGHDLELTVSTAQANSFRALTGSIVPVLLHRVADVQRYVRVVACIPNLAPTGVNDLQWSEFIERTLNALLPVFVQVDLIRFADEFVLRPAVAVAIRQIDYYVL